NTAGQRHQSCDGTAPRACYFRLVVQFLPLGNAGWARIQRVVIGLETVIRGLVCVEVALWILQVETTDNISPLSFGIRGDSVTPFLCFAVIPAGETFDVVGFQHAVTYGAHLVVIGFYGLT